MAGNILTDDFVADVLAKEASDASVQYSAGAFRPSKPANKAKPNTRFLGRIIKQTASHNAALSAREAAEAQARLDRLTEAEEKRRRRHRPTAGDMRRRQLGAISSILLGRRRQPDRADADADEPAAPPAAERPGERRPGDRSGRHRESGRKSDGAAGEREAVEGSRRGRRDEAAGEKAAAEGSRRDEAVGEKEAGDGSRRGRRDREHRRDKEHRHDKEHRRGRDGRSRSPARRDPRRHRHRSPLGGGEHGGKRGGGREDGLAARGDDSDPPQDLVGPLPASAVRARGRGAGRASSAAMDSHFDEDYDPSLDVQPDEGTPGASGAQQGPRGWADAVEAFRDRQKGRRQGAARLLAGGLTDGQTQTREEGDEKDTYDVTWSKAGERREWDRGKGPE